MTKLKLLTDQEINKDTVPEHVGLDFNVYAKVLASVARNTPGPFNIGIFGEWGTGKTSLMRLIQKELQSESDSENEFSNLNVLTVFFNVWQYEKEEHPIIPLVASLIHVIEKNDFFKNKFDKISSGLTKTLRSIAYGFSTKSKIKIPGFAEVEASFVAKDMIDRDNQLSYDPLLDRSLYFQAFDKLSDIEIPENDVRIVVFIDDLDRCFPDVAIQLLESIKLILSQRGFVFFLGVAHSVVEGYLRHRYKEKYGIEDFDGTLYLGKIVQLPFYIPPNIGKMDGLAKVILARLEEEPRKKLEEILPVIGDVLGGNPRSLIRLVNGVLVDLEINANFVVGSNNSLIPVEFFAISRCLQATVPKMYDAIFRYDKTEEISDWDDGQISDLSSSDNKIESLIAKTLKSNISVNRLLKKESGKSWLTSSELRTAAMQFLNLGFSSGDDINHSEYSSLSNEDLETLMLKNEDSLQEKNHLNDIGIYNNPSEIRRLKRSVDRMRRILKQRGWHD